MKANLQSESYEGRGSTSESSHASFHIDFISHESQLPCCSRSQIQHDFPELAQKMSYLLEKKKNWCLTLLRIGNFLTFPGVAKNVRLFLGVNAAGADDPLL